MQSCKSVQPCILTIPLSASKKQQNLCIFLAQFSQTFCGCNIHIKKLAFSTLSCYDVDKALYDPELLEINTLENAIYMAMQNDVSFMIGLRLSLYEHQSTFNPNLPLRYLFYIFGLILGYDRQKQIIRFTKNFDSAGIRHLL